MAKHDDAAEEKIRARVADDAFDEATEMTLRSYGDEFYNYIRRITGDELLAEEAFQNFSVDLWEGWEAFDTDKAVRPWAYSIARNATYDLLREEQRRKERPFRTDEQRNLVDEWTRTVTKNFEKTEAKSWLWDVVEEFGPEKRELIVLRIGHRMKWKEVARIMTDEELDDDELRRASNRLRKKYQRLKETLRARRDEFDG